MEKIQMDAILAVQTMPQTSRYQTTDLTKTDFSRLLKKQNSPVSQTKDAKASEKLASNQGSETAGPVKDTGTKDPADTKAEESEEGKDGETIPAELLLQLQGAAGLLTVPVQTEVVEPGQTETVEPGVATEAVSELMPAETVNTDGMASAESADTVPEAVVPAEAGLDEAGLAQPVTETQVLTTESPAAPQKQPVQETKAEPVRADSSKEAPKESRAPEASQDLSESQTKETAVAPVKAQTESQPESKTKEEAQPEQAFSGMEHLQLRNHPVGEMKAADAGTATVRTTETTLVEDVGRTLAERFPQKDGMLTIELEPASLGKLTVQVLYEGGRAMVSILATNPKTLELLSQKASELGAILEEHTGQETIVYTEQPEAEQPYDERQREGERREQEPDSEEQQSDRASQESFAQQLRLGLL